MQEQDKTHITDYRSYDKTFIMYFRLSRRRHFCVTQNRNLEPDLQNILRQSYGYVNDSAKVPIDLRRTFNL